MRLIILAACVALCGCNAKASAAKDAEREYKLVSESALSPEKCKAAQKVRQAWLEAGDKAKFETWDVTAYVDCAKAGR